MFVRALIQCVQWSICAGRTKRFGVLWLLPVLLPTARALGDDDPRAGFARDFVPVVQQFCIECHQGEAPEGEVQLGGELDAARVPHDRAHWETVLKMLESGAMPPDDQPQPSPEQRAAAVAGLSAALNYVDCSQPRDPGHVTLRRLNRNEYDNTIRDLLGVDLRPARNFPSDDVGYGFDNIGDVLSLPPLLMEKYLDAAELVAAAAIYTGDPDQIPTQKRVGGELRPSGSAQATDGGGYIMSSVGSVTGSFTFRRAGRYRVRVTAAADQAGDELAKLRLELAGHQTVVEVAATQDEPQEYTWELMVEAGQRDLSVTFFNDYYNPRAADPAQRDRNMYVHAVQVTGPVDVSAEDLPASHKRLIIATPEDPRQRSQVRAAARQVLEPLVTRAFRRPATPDDLRPLIQLVELATDNGESFERGIQLALTAVLVSPHFLFRIEQQPVVADPQRSEPIGQYELATRLSYFLWSSMPDDELLAAARDRKLSSDSELSYHVQRMLRDPKSRALAENFGGQWLNLRNLDEVTPDPEKFARFDGQLREAMYRETIELIAYIIREDRSILDFLTADYTFANERLAELYGLEGVEGDGLQRVSLADTKRRGVITHGSILTLTSNPGRTSAVKRGKWILENILGTPPPDPPPGIPLLEATQQAAPDLPLRKQLELHRQDPVCASCHRQMDALGFALENYDPIGRWREQDGSNPIDASGVLPDGEQFNGAAEMIAVLSKQKSRFCRTLAEKMLTYALGRGLEPYDKCAVDEIVARVEAADYRMSEMIMAIVASEPFRLRRGAAEAGTTE